MVKKENDKVIWFPAKRYGWGWGPPVRWQGWAVLILYLLLLGFCTVWLLPRCHVLVFLLLVYALTAALLLVCWFKGEKPRWRWGNE